MQEFIEIPANKISLARRKLMCGRGINDADYMVNPKVNGEKVICPFYRAWRDMMVRCYSEKANAARPTYINATVCAEWLHFTAFKSWMTNQDWEGNALDKDIILPGNKEYSPETCCFVSKAVNALLTNHAARRGACPQGVSLHRATGRYAAEISISGKTRYLGLYDTIPQAETVYNAVKSAYIIEKAHEQSEHKVRDGLLLHAGLIKA